MESKKVLIVDDDKELLEELCETLNLCGYEVTTVSQSVDAVKLARETKPDVILLDLKMNKVNGFHIAKELKGAKATSGIPIIAMSGHFPIENQSVLLDMSSIDKAIKKPFGISELITELESVLYKG